jgi:hypothetical protein
VRPDELDAPELVVTSAFSKAVASTATYPHEVIRSYMHVSGSGPLAGLSDAVRTIYREDGVRGFYRGCGTNLLRTTPAAALTFTSFELIARGMRRLGEQRAARERAGAAARAAGAEQAQWQADAAAAWRTQQLGQLEQQVAAAQQHQQQQQQQQQWQGGGLGAGPGGGGGQGSLAASMVGRGPSAAAAAAAARPPKT